MRIPDNQIPVLAHAVRVGEVQSTAAVLSDWKRARENETRLLSALKALNELMQLSICPHSSAETCDCSERWNQATRAANEQVPEALRLAEE